MNSVHKGQESLWIGWPGINHDEIDKQMGSIKITKKEGYFPASLNQKKLKIYGLSNKSLSLFHYFIEFSVFDKEQWKSYEEVNQKFADSIVKYRRRGWFDS